MHDEQLLMFTAIENTHWWFVARREILGALIRKILRPSTGKTIVDIGCGTGGNLAALRDDYSCTGFDASATALQEANSSYPNIRFIQMAVTGEQHPLIKSADLVMLADVIEHIENDHEYMQQLVSQMKPGAHLLVTVPAHLRLWTKHDETVLHFRRYEEETFHALLNPLKLEMRLFSFFNWRLYPVIRFVRFLNRILGRTSGMTQTDFQMPSPPLNRLLIRIFAGERKRLLRAIDSGKPAYNDGVSLIAILRKPL